MDIVIDTLERIERQLADLRYQLINRPIALEKRRINEGADYYHDVVDG